MVHTLPMKTLEQITLFNDIYILYKYVCFGAFSFVCSFSFLYFVVVFNQTLFHSRFLILDIIYQT